MELDVRHPLLVPGEGEVVGDSSDRRVEILCDRDEPASGGRPAADAVIVPAGTGGVLVDSDEIRIEVRGEPGPASGRLTCRYVLEDGRFLEIQA